MERTPLIVTQMLGRKAHELCTCGDTYDKHSPNGSHFCMVKDCLCTRFTTSAEAAAMRTVMNRKSGQGSAVQFRSPTATDG